MQTAFGNARLTHYDNATLKSSAIDVFQARQSPYSMTRLWMLDIDESMTHVGSPSRFRTAMARYALNESDSRERSQSHGDVAFPSE